MRDDKLFEGMSDEESKIFQLRQWVNGKSYHNPVRDECCPDFSCCTDRINTPIEVRKLFMDAYMNGDEELTNGLLVAFLIGGLSTISDVEIDS